MAGPLAKKELLAEGYTRRNGKREEGSWQKTISDYGQHHDKWLYADTKRKDEERVGRRTLSLQ